MDGSGGAGSAAALGLPQPGAAPSSTPAQTMTPEQEAATRSIQGRLSSTDARPLPLQLVLYEVHRREDQVGKPSRGHQATNQTD
jgi:hypothetical protein